MGKKGYETVVDMAAGKQDWGLRLLFEVLDPDERPEKIAECFLLAAGCSADEAALKFYKFLQQSFKDIEATPRVEETEGVTVYTHDEIDVMRSRADNACTLKTMELYPRIAGFKMSASGKYTKDKRWIAPRKATLLETKKAMLEQVSSRWKNTASDREADDCFLFLVAVFEFALFHEEDELFEKMMRTATPERFPLNRLVRHYLLLPKPDTFHSGFNHKIETIGKIILNAWTRNNKFEDIANLFQAIKPLLAISQNGRQSDNGAVYDLLGRVVTDIVLLYASAEDLRKSMDSSVSLMMYRVPGDIRISYPWLGRINVLIEILSDFCSLYGEKYDSSEAHRWFELARDYVIKWREQHINYSVSLTLVVKQGDRDNRLFSRNQSFGK